MAKGCNCAVWLSWVTLIVGVLYLLAAWIPDAFSWWGEYFPTWGVLFVLIGLWKVTSK